MSPDDPTLNCFYVELPDGEKRTLVFLDRRLNAAILVDFF
jgi:hypothetical protein